MRSLEKIRYALIIVLPVAISIDKAAAWGQSLFGQGQFRVIAKSGDTAPDGISTLDFKSFRNATIDDQQRVTFSGFLENNDVVVYGERNGQLQLLLREGQLMPRATGGMASFYSLSPTDIHWNYDGRIVADGYVSFSENGMAVGDAPQGLTMVLVSGETPPGHPSRIEFAWIEQAAINKAGEVAAFGIADGTFQRQRSAGHVSYNAWNGWGLETFLCRREA